MLNSKIEDLPNELIFHILQMDLDPAMICHFGGTCKRFHTIAQDEKIWEKVVDVIGIPKKKKLKSFYKEVKSYVIQLKVKAYSRFIRKISKIEDSLNQKILKEFIRKQQRIIPTVEQIDRLKNYKNLSKFLSLKHYVGFQLLNSFNTVNEVLRSAIGMFFMFLCIPIIYEVQTIRGQVVALSSLALGGAMEQPTKPALKFSARMAGLCIMGCFVTLTDNPLTSITAAIAYAVGILLTKERASIVKTLGKIGSTLGNCISSSIRLIAKACLKS